MSIENNIIQKQQKQNTDEEQQNLLKSQNDLQFVENQSENEHSRMDQSIDIGQSVDKNVNGYEELINSETSLYNPQKQLRFKEEQEKPTIFTRVKNSFKNFFGGYPCKKSDKVFTDGQLAVGMFLQSAAAFYLIKQRKSLIEKRNKSMNDEKVLRNIDQNLQKNGFVYLDSSTNGQKILVKGKIKARDIKKNTEIKVTSQKQEGVQPNIKLGKKETRNIVLTTDQFSSASVPIPLQSQKGLVTSAVAAATYFTSSNIFKIKFKTDSINNLSNSIYFFGQKSMTNFSVDQVFQKIDYLKIKSDQRALQICAILATGFAAFFAIKAIKSGVELAKRKKGYFSRLLLSIQEYLQL